MPPISVIAVIVASVASRTVLIWLAISALVSCPVTWITCTNVTMVRAPGVIG
jgi:hypothetical protein